MCILDKDCTLISLASEVNKFVLRLLLLCVAAAAVEQASQVILSVFINFKRFRRRKLVQGYLSED